jgi:hypothetical protein
MTDIVGGGMSDGRDLSDIVLRDRIAAVICGMDALRAQQWSLDVADAVIAALDRDYIIVTPGTPLAQRIAQWHLSRWPDE